jgi:hypothetical protein
MSRSCIFGFLGFFMLAVALISCPVALGLRSDSLMVQFAVTQDSI